jgi:hypothetical protein
MTNEATHCRGSTPRRPNGRISITVGASLIWGDAEGLVCPNVQTVPPSAGYLKRPQVTKGPGSRLGPTSSGTFSPATLRGPAPNGHPCPDGALAASMPLVPLRAACVQPAPKSRFAVSGLLRYEDQERSALCAVWVKDSFHWLNTKPVGVSLLTNAVSHSSLMKLARSYHEQTDGDCSHPPRGNACNDALRHPGCGACCQAVRPSRNGLTPLV